MYLEKQQVVTKDQRKGNSTTRMATQHEELDRVPERESEIKMKQESQRFKESIGEFESKGIFIPNFAKFRQLNSLSGK